MIIEYVGLAEKVADGFTVFFPDFPGFGSEGGTLEEARQNAREGLIAHLELMLEDGESIPKPLLLDDVVQLSESKGCILLTVAIVAPSGRAQRINITIDQALLNAIDLAAANQHKSRSALIAEAAQRLLGLL